MQYGSEEERSLIEKFVMYPILLTVFNRDLQIINGSPFKLRQPYVALIEQIMNQISKDLFDVRVELRKRRIKVMDGKREGDITEYEIFIRGYREIMRFPNIHLKNKTETLMLSYLHVLAE
ncbi:hypothetical protein AWM68_04145 [Fictibacillus phosphorivorans]|uniref:Uncharacterized protein n=1 Tax=Fictibacillus phosphorivorans TaxID=1221500 RepID=A0A165P9T7_9BACL|nr:hypothetical protein [Fictibacillus phosphorivorans]KZE69463.1 hypothetical protein AWM68_04145 [Fictibacillus phosphorivorans]